MKAYNSTNVYDAAIQRTVEVYKQGHRVVVAFSAGKDSTVALEIAIEAARIAGCLPVEVWMQDEEIMFPGTYEYAERVYNRKEVNFHWFVCHEPSFNIFNRAVPYYWVFDNLLKPEQWMRTPPPYAKLSDHQDIYNVVNPESFPPPPGKFLYVLMGVRASESRRRNMMIHTIGGAISGTTKAKNSDLDRSLEMHIRPIYDWSTKDVWLAIKEKGWDYNTAYDVFTRFGIPMERQRIAPVTMTIEGIDKVQMSAKAWPDWFDRLAVRLPGVRLGALYGRQAVVPYRHSKDTWKQTYQRVCIDEAPEWIAERAIKYRDLSVERHAKHSTEPILETKACPMCSMGRISWSKMTYNMYNGDPFILSTTETALGQVEPEFFRPGAGTWDKKRMKF